MTEEPRLTLPLGERDHVQGGDSAKVTLVEYGDYQCPHCGHAYPIIKQLQRHFGDRLLFAFRNFPIASSHPQAELAAEAAEAAGAQGKFWEMHDAIYEHQNNLTERSLLAMAEKLGLDTDRISRDLAKGTYRARVKEDFMSGVRSGVNGTPGFFIDSYRYDGEWDFDTLSDVLKSVIVEGKTLTTEKNK